MKKVIKAGELETTVNAVNNMLDSDRFSIIKPLNGSSYVLNYAGKPVMNGTKKDLFCFLNTYKKVLLSDYE